MPSAQTEYTLKKIIWIASERENSKDALLLIPEEEAERNSEEILQLKEGCSYEYELQNEKSKLETIPGLIIQSRKHAFRGRITPGNYVGRLPLRIITESETIDLAVEVRSSKSDYRSEYRTMLEDITAECTDLLMIHSSPVTQKFTVDYSGDSESLYQRFSFVQSMINSEDFNNAVLRIINSPITRWKTETENIDSRRVRRVSSSHIRQFASGNNRIPLSETHPLKSRMQSIPRELNTVIKTDTLDNPENRFIKHALTEFARFSGFICLKIEEAGQSPVPNIYYEAKRLEEKLSEWLNHNTFREVSQITALPLNNPVLQRKEGYREVFKIWLMYDLAAKLTWNGLDPDTYTTGKRDVATLYEYWLFFILLRMIEAIFEIPPTETRILIQETKDGLGLQLKSGKHTAIKGIYTHKKRKLRMKFNYNRTFSYAEFPRSGSWTQKMRPDYTLSFWPADFSEDEAEEQELIVHIHFDAKYKVDDLQYILNPDEQVDEDSDELNTEKALEKTGNYKRADLLKMHAYKDAIRRTAGAYVLYPGSNSKPYRGFHELIPGLGAFAVSPSNNADGIEEVKKFIMSVLDHFSDRSTSRETHSFYTYKIMNSVNRNSIHENIPEYTSISGRKERTKPTAETNVLIGYVRSEEQKEWIFQNGFYNIRMDKKITPEIASADYLLLYKGFIGEELNLLKNGLFKIKSNPEIKSIDWLRGMGYPESRNPKPEYFIYEIENNIKDWSENKIKKIELKQGEVKYRPITRKINEIIG
jgi:predicted component of viral defense system (DUF524 family)